MGCSTQTWRRVYTTERILLLQVFSCRLGNEQETALSILDPALIQVELVGNSSYPNGSGLLDAFNGGDFPPLLEVRFSTPLPKGVSHLEQGVLSNSRCFQQTQNIPFPTPTRGEAICLGRTSGRPMLEWVCFFSRLQIQLQTLDIRLSYNDVQLFLAIAKSISKQTSGGLPSPPAPVDPSAPSGSSCVNEVSGTTAERTEVSQRLLDPVLGRDVIFKLGLTSRPPRPTPGAATTCWSLSNSQVNELLNLSPALLSRGAAGPPAGTGIRPGGLPQGSAGLSRCVSFLWDFYIYIKAPSFASRMPFEVAK